MTTFKTEDTDRFVNRGPGIAFIVDSQTWSTSPRVLVSSRDQATGDVIANHNRIKGDVLLGDANDVFTGTGRTAGAVSGGFGNDRLIGGRANHTLDGGGLGGDTLIGGTSRDYFALRSDLNPTRNVVGAAAHDANDHVIYDPNKGLLIFDANGSRLGGAVHFRPLGQHLALTHADSLVTDRFLA